MDLIKLHDPAALNEAHARKRSRGGCVDCKKAKVKCDEARPTCGTCTRRRHVCQGYPNAKTQLRWQQAEAAGASRRKRRRGAGNALDSAVGTHANLHGASSPSARNDGFPHLSSPDCLTDMTPTSNQTRRTSESSTVSTVSCGVSECCLAPSSPRTICPIPPGTVPPDDEPSINIYFNRHPFELVIGSEFVEEMNALTLLIFQLNPKAIGNTLSAIGQVYLDTNGSGSLVPVLSKKARTLAKLRSMKDPGKELEQVILMVLGLSAIELIDANSGRREYSIPILIGYVASVINQHVRAGLVLSSVAKYFTRALARQDMVMSLVARRRPFIQAATWLDADSQNTVDRLMGYTMSLMPLLEELCGLAEDVRCGRPGSGAVIDGSASDDSLPFIDQGDQYAARASDLCARITAWRPVPSHKISVQMSRTCLLQAYACRSAALLYLYRLLNPPGRSPEIDGVALGMACEILVHLRAPPDELRMSLWPAFLAACELETEDDRATAIEVFDCIYSSRKTTTPLHTKAFCLRRVWKARDTGQDWNWMTLAQQYPGECLPI